MVQIVWQLMMATGLAAAAGLRAFVPLLVVGIAARLELVPLAEGFEWLASTPALTVLSVAVVLEVLADKVPFVDHVLDVTATFARPIAGALAAASSLVALDPLVGALVGLVLGGGVASGIHVAKSTLRVASTGISGGVANPAVSLGEDAVCLTCSVASLFVPFLTFTVTVGALYLLVRFGARRDGRAPTGSGPPSPG